MCVLIISPPVPRIHHHPYRNNHPHIFMFVLLCSLFFQVLVGFCIGNSAHNSCGVRCILLYFVVCSLCFLSCSDSSVHVSCMVPCYAGVVRCVFSDVVDVVVQIIV